MKNYRLLVALVLVGMATVASAAPPKIRILMLRHDFDGATALDIDMTYGAVVHAIKEQQLPVEVIGSYGWISNDLTALSPWLVPLMKEKATPGDTLIIYTAGHGTPNHELNSWPANHLVGLGPRRDVCEAIAAASDQTGQRVIWWQLSCFAASGLPDCNKWTPARRKRFCVMNSSAADAPSRAGAQSFVLARVLAALADGRMDLNDDGIIDANEMRASLNATRSDPRGRLLHASPDCVLFTASK
jgi:hypothetical protein